MLDVENLTVAFGKHVALDGVSIGVERGEMVAILGANGAGKSSLLGAVGGRLRPAAGAIRYRGADLLALPQHALVEEGIALVPEGRGIFPGLSVAENLALGARPDRARGKAEATREHPAQVQVYHEDVVIGYWTKTDFSGAIPERRQRELLARVEQLQDAVKKARETANTTEVEWQKQAANLLTFVFGDV